MTAKKMTYEFVRRLERDAVTMASAQRSPMITLSHWEVLELTGEIRRLMAERDRLLVALCDAAADIRPTDPEHAASIDALIKDAADARDLRDGL